MINCLSQKGKCIANQTQSFLEEGLNVGVGRWVFIKRYTEILRCFLKKGKGLSDAHKLIDVQWYFWHKEVFV